MPFLRARAMVCHYARGLRAASLVCAGVAPVAWRWWAIEFTIIVGGQHVLAM